MSPSLLTLLRKAKRYRHTVSFVVLWSQPACCFYDLSSVLSGFCHPGPCSGLRKISQDLRAEISSYQHGSSGLHQMPITEASDHLFTRLPGNAPHSTECNAEAVALAARMPEPCPAAGTELPGHNFAARLLITGQHTAWRQGTSIPRMFMSALLDLPCLFPSFLSPSESDIMQILMMQICSSAETRVLHAAPQNCLQGLNFLT